MRPRVIIVGGGIAGVSLGYELAPDHDVVILEAESELAAHSTGRSAALFLTTYGPEMVRALTAASDPLYQRFAHDWNAPSLLQPRGLLLTAWTEPVEQQLQQLIEQAGPHVLDVTAAEARHMCPALRTDDLMLAAHDPSARDIDVMALHAGYVRALLQRGGRVERRAQLSCATHGPQGWTIDTSDGRKWTADIIVNASGAWGDKVAAICGVEQHTLNPCRRTVVIAQPASPVDPSWPVVADAAESWYFKPEGDALLLCPGDETPVAPGDVKADPLDVAIALERVNAVTTFDLRSIRTSWAGLRTFTPDRLPVVGIYPENPAIFCFLGQGGYGIQMAPALAAAAAQLLREERPTTASARMLDELSPRRLSNGHERARANG